MNPVCLPGFQIWTLAYICFVVDLFLSSCHAPVNALVISKSGASGDFPGCTDKAYTKAIEDGVNVLDCPVQMSKDGIPFCFSSINLIDSTDAAQSPFSNRTTRIPEIKPGNGIFTFSLTWSEIQELTREFKIFLIFLSWVTLLKNIYARHVASFFN